MNGYRNGISVSLFCVARPLSLHLLLHIQMPNELQYHSKSCHVCFDSHSQMYSGRSSTPTEPFHKKARTGFKLYKLAKAARSSLKTSSTWVSLSQPTRYHDLCSITPSTCYCVHPLNGLRYFWALSSEKIQDSLPTRHEAIFVFDPLNLPWTLLTFSIPKNSYMCWIFYTTFTVKLCQTVLFCFLVIWTILQGWALA